MVLRDPRAAILQAGARPPIAPPMRPPGVMPPAGLPAPPGIPPPVGAAGPPGMPPGMPVRPDLQPRPPGLPGPGPGAPGDGGMQPAPPAAANTPEAMQNRQMMERHEEAFRRQQQLQLEQGLHEIMEKVKEAEAEQDHDPNYPKWFDLDDLPRPVAHEVTEAVRKDHTRYQYLLTRMAEDLDTVGMNSVGIFRNFDRRVETPFYDPTLAADTHMTASIMGTADIYYDAVARRADHKDEAEAKEAALQHWRKQDEELHAEAGNGDLGIDEAQNLLVYGRIVKRIILNLDAESWDNPFITHLVDPATCFPTFEAQRGLKTMRRYYSMKIADIIGTFGAGGKEDAIRNRLLENRDFPGREMSTSLNMMEHWDRRWYGVLVDGQWIHGPIEHKYGCVPFVMELSPLGRPPFTRSPWGNGTRRPDVNANARFEYSQDEELADQGLSYIHFMKVPHRQREALLGRFYTEAAKQINPPVIIEQDDMMFRKGPPKISSAEGARNRLVRGRESISPFPTAPSPAVTNPLMAVLSENYAKWGLSPASYGLAENAGQTGTAIESLTNADSIKFAAFMKAKTRFHRREAEFKLKLLRNFGWMIGSENHRGEYIVPIDQPRQEKYTSILLTHGMLRRTGIDVKVRLTSLKLQNLGPLGNAVSLWRNAGLMTKEEALELRDVKDPEATIRKIRIEEVQDSEAFKNAETLAALREEGHMTLYYEFKAQLDKEKSSGPPGQPGMGPGGAGGPQGAPPGAAPPAGAGGGPVGVQGASMPQFGSPAGTEGGRPPGPPQGMPGAI